MATTPRQPTEQPPKTPIARNPAKTTVVARSASMPAEYLPADATALQALAAGAADPVQQKRALDWIINQAAGTYDLSYRPGGEDGRRDTDFAEGRRFVGSQIVKMLKISVAAIQRLSDGPTENG